MAAQGSGKKTKVGNKAIGRQVHKSNTTGRYAAQRSRTERNKRRRIQRQKDRIGFRDNPTYYEIRYARRHQVVEAA